MNHISACHRMLMRDLKHPIHLRRNALLELIDGQKDAFRITQKTLAVAFPDSSEAKFPDDIAAQTPQQLQEFYRATLPNEDEPKK